MTHFRPCLERRFDHPLSRDEIHQWVDRLVGSDNVFVALRLDGQFETAKVRTVPRQEPLSPHAGSHRTATAVPLCRGGGNSGGLSLPAVRAGVNVAGFHEHMITADRKGAAICSTTPWPTAPCGFLWCVTSIWPCHRIPLSGRPTSTPQISIALSAAEG